MTGHHKIRPIVYQLAYPTVSRNFAVDNYLIRPNGTYLLTYGNYVLHLLPAPYSTNCVPNELFDLFDYYKCIVPRSLKELGHLPHSEIYTERLDYKFFSYAQLANESISQAYEKIESFCDRVSATSGKI